MELTESQEMYLISAYKLRKKLVNVREVDIAEDRGYSTPSTHNALKALSKLGLVNFVAGDITLTREGENIVEHILEKHNLIAKAFVIMGATPESAEENACRVEHVLSDDIYEILRNHIMIGEKKLMSKMMHPGEENKD